VNHNDLYPPWLSDSFFLFLQNVIPLDAWYAWPWHSFALSGFSVVTALYEHRIMYNVTYTHMN